MKLALATLSAIALAACGGAATGNAAEADAGQAANAAAQNQATAADGARQGQPFAVTPVAEFTAPWAIDFLPDGRLVVTEKAGKMFVMRPDASGRTEIAGVPGVDSAGQGGLMDVVPGPGFANDGLLYYSYSEAGEGGKGVVLARARLVEADGRARLEDNRVLFRANPYVSGNGHYAGRIAFAPDGRHLFFSTGDRQKFTPAQDPQATLGKILRFTADGRPAGDPGLTRRGFHPAIWSYGHRNPLGIAFDRTGNLWEQEMGPKGGDEVNLILPGRNYGYPLVSDGDHYDGRPIPDHSTRPDLEAPKVVYTPVISPGGLIVYSGRMFPDWAGDLFIGGLSSEALVRVDVDGTNARAGDQFPMGHRIRDVAESADGAIWVIEDGEDGTTGRLLRLTRN